MANDWRSAFFKQAKSDFQLFKKLAEDDNVPHCQKLHYLLMTTERCQKASKFL